MLSKKMAFSLMSLITILALAFAVTSAMAVGEFAVTVEGPTMVTYEADATLSNPLDAIKLKVTADQPIPSPLITAGADADPPTNTISVAAFDEDGVMIDLTESNTGTVTVTDLPKTPANTDDPSYAMRTAKMRQLSVVITPGTTSTIAEVIIGVTALTSTNPRIVLTPAATHAGANMSLAVYHTITVSKGLPANNSRPMVVSIQRLRPGSQTVVAAFQEAEVTGPFDVRIVISELPHDFKIDHIEVTNGTKSGFVAGAPFLRRITTTTQGREVTDNTVGPMDTILPHPIEGMYEHSAVGRLVGVLEGEMGYVPLPSAEDEGGTDNMYHQYRVTITPHRRASEVKVHVKEFHDNATPYKNFYQPIGLDSKPNGRDQLRLKVNIPKHDLEAGYRIYLPHEEKPDFPADGHYILARNKDGSFINYSHHEDTATPDRENMSKEQTLAQLKFNVRETVAGTPAARARTADEPQFQLPNLEAFLANDGTIHLVSYVRDGDNPKYTTGAAYISEVMWGTDASQSPVSLSNWVEIRRNGDKIDVGAQDWALWFYEAHETPPTAYPANSSYEGAIGQPGEIIDIIGTKASDTGLSWSIAGKGQNGRSNIDIARVEAQVLAPTTPLISMYRVMVADTSTGAAAGAMKPGDGTLAGSWMQTEGPSVNLQPGREDAIIATPGAAPFETPDIVAAEEKAKEDKAKADADALKEIAGTGTIPQLGSIYISEIMFAGGGVLPQWIEISNGSRSEEINLSGWTITVDNAAADADVDVGATATFTIPDGTKIDPSGQSDTPSTILVVTEKGRNNLTGADASGQVINLAEDNEVELILAGVVTGKYTLLSNMAFMITLAPPEPGKDETAAAKTKRLAAEKAETVIEKATRTAAEKVAAKERKDATDMAGNLGADGAAAWVLPMSEDGRSSIIRGHVQVTRGPAAPEMGNMMDSWVLASDTSFAQVTHIRASSYYGAASDVGTPGFRAGGALPVELSQFRPARNKETGAVVITWSTQSELNNAGFFIKRSQQRDGEFKIINAAMIPGAGTTSEKQFYTYNDTTAQPNVVYYYQIEDVSLDGNRQTLTNGIRLKGHVSVAGKLTTLWGDLKTSQ